MEDLRTPDNKHSEKLSKYKRFTKRAGEIASRPGLAVALVNDWLNYGTITIANTATSAYDQVGGWPGVAAGALACGTVGIAEQYVAGRCANTVAGSKNSRLFKWIKTDFVGQRLGVKEGQPHRQMGIASTAITGIAMGNTAVVLNERLLGGATHEEGKNTALRGAAIFGVTVGTLGGIAAGSSEVAHLLGSDYTAGLIKDVVKDKLLWGTAAAITISAGIYSTLRGNSNEPELAS